MTEGMSSPVEDDSAALYLFEDWRNPRLFDACTMGYGRIARSDPSATEIGNTAFPIHVIFVICYTSAISKERLGGFHETS